MQLDCHSALHRRAVRNTLTGANNRLPTLPSLVRMGRLTKANVGNLHPELLADYPADSGSFEDFVTICDYHLQPITAPAGSLRALLEGLLLDVLDEPEGGPPREWYRALAPAAAAMKHVIASHFPDYLGSTRFACKEVLAILRGLGRPADADALAAAFEAMRANEGGRAVLAVSDVGRDRLTLGMTFLDKMAADAGLEDELRRVYDGKPFLPVLLTAAAYYRALVAGGKGAGSAGGGVGGK